VPQKRQQGADTTTTTAVATTTTATSTATTTTTRNNDKPAGTHTLGSTSTAWEGGSDGSGADGVRNKEGDLGFCDCCDAVLIAWNTLAIMWSQEGKCDSTCTPLHQCSRQPTRGVSCDGTEQRH
jgi:hypothetical protein